MRPTTDSFGPLSKVSCVSNPRPSVSLQTPVLFPAMSFDLEEDDLEQSSGLFSPPHCTPTAEEDDLNLG